MVIFSKTFNFLLFILCFNFLFLLFYLDKNNIKSPNVIKISIQIFPFLIQDLSVGAFDLWLIYWSENLTF